MLELIEHLDSSNQNLALEEVRRVLKPGGQFVISMPNMSKIWRIPYLIVWFFWERTVQREYYHDHIGMVPRERLIALLEAHSFRIRSVNRKAIFDLIIDCVNLKI